MSKERNCRTEAKTTNKKADKTQEQQMLETKKCMAMLKDNEISKQKCLLVQGAGSHWKHKPVTNANILMQAKDSLKN